jgi:hypothetical protein
MPEVGKKLVVQEDITDWRDECMRYEEDVVDKDDLVRLVTEGGFSTVQVGRMAIVHRELGTAPGDILRSNKTLLASAASDEVGTRAAQCKREIEMPSGRTYAVRQFAGPAGRPPKPDGEASLQAPAPDEGRSYAKFDSDRGMARVTHYLENIVPGHIFERLKQIAAAGGDVGSAADTLHDKIDEMVQRLVEPSEL